MNTNIPQTNPNHPPTNEENHMAVKFELMNMKVQIDEVFGEGFAASNPALVEKALDAFRERDLLKELDHAQNAVCVAIDGAQSIGAKVHDLKYDLLNLRDLSERLLKRADAVKESAGELIGDLYGDE